MMSDSKKQHSQLTKEFIPYLIENGYVTEIKSGGNIQGKLFNQQAIDFVKQFFDPSRLGNPASSFSLRFKVENGRIALYRESAKDQQVNLNRLALPYLQDEGLVQNDNDLSVDLEFDGDELISFQIQNSNEPVVLSAEQEQELFTTIRSALPAEIGDNGHVSISNNVIDQSNIVQENINSYLSVEDGIGNASKNTLWTFDDADLVDPAAEIKFTKS